MIKRILYTLRMLVIYELANLIIRLAPDDDTGYLWVKGLSEIYLAEAELEP